MSYEGNDVNKCFQCGSALEEKKGNAYCTRQNTPLGLPTCYYSWNTHPKNRIIASLEELQ